jgi:hypothetical protein
MAGEQIILAQRRSLQLGTSESQETEFESLKKVGLAHVHTEAVFKSSSTQVQKLRVENFKSQR